MAWCCSIGDAYCCCFSYHALFNLRYHHRAEKTTAAKRMGVEKNISVRELGRRLDTTLFLDEIPSWEPSGTHHLFSTRECSLMQRLLDKKNMTRKSTGPLAALIRKRCPGGGSQHGAADTQIHMGRDHGFIPPSVSAEKKPRRNTLFWRYSRRDSHRDIGDAKCMPLV